MRSQLCVEVADPSQVGAARRESVKMAQAANLDEVRTGEVAIVATELANNLSRYGKGGRLLMQVMHDEGGASLELMAVDSGPGIGDLQACMRDGYSTGGTAGTGLGAVRRLSDDFDCYSLPEQGTVVLSRVRGQRRASTGFAVGAVSIPAPYEDVCGDTWCVAERPGEIAAMVADGLGHGPAAAEAAARASASFREHPFGDPTAFFPRAHQNLTGSRGAAVACAHVMVQGAVRYAGVGNIAGTLIGPEGRRGLPSQNGTVGVAMRSVAPSGHYAWPDKGLLIMHSDGVLARWTLDAYPGLLVRHPAVVAAILWRDFVRGRDDATVVVISAPRRTGSS